MAKKDRKTMLAGLMQAPAGSRPAAPSPVPTLRRGAVGAISSAVADMQANAVLDLDPDTIRAGGLADRIGTVAEEDAELRRSMARHGQQVPILVRPHPDEPRRWQIVYGRRRVRAARALGIRVKALVRDLDDEALVIAQGQENAVRRDLSFVEKANFARQMVEAGYARAAICDALAVDKTLVSRMLSVIERLPVALVQAIGAAHGVGRPRWLELADLLDGRERSVEALRTLAAEKREEGSAARFEAVLHHLRREEAKAAAPASRAGPVPLHADDGTRIASARRIGREGRLSLTLARADGFDAWLLEALPALHARWHAGKEEDLPREEGR